VKPINSEKLFIVVGPVVICLERALANDAGNQYDRPGGCHRLRNKVASGVPDDIPALGRVLRQGAGIELAVPPLREPA
jgi:hypothetical protein